MSALAAVLAFLLAAASPIDGSWRLRCETEAGPVETTRAFKASGEKLLLVDEGGETVIGTFKDGAIEFVIPNGLPDVGFAADLVVTAKLSGDKITGYYEYLDYAGPVTGARQR